MKELVTTRGQAKLRINTRKMAVLCSCVCVCACLCRTGSSYYYASLDIFFFVYDK